MRKWLIPMIVAAVLVGAYFAVLTVLDIRISAARHALRAAGHPATVEDLESSFSSGREPVARLYDSAAAALDRHEKRRLAYYDSLGWREDPGGLDSLVRARAPVLDQLQRATELGPARFGQDWRAGCHARLAAPVSRFGEFHLLLHLAARDLLSKNRPDSAIAILGRAWSLTGAFAEPLLIHHVVTILSQDSAISLIARAAPLAGTSAIERTIERLQASDLDASLFAAFEVEAAMMQSALEQGYQGGVDERGNPIDFPYMSLPPLRRHVQLRQLQLTRRVLNILRLPVSEALPAVDELERDLAGSRIVCRLVRMAVVSPRWYYLRTKRLAALRDAAVTGLKVLVHRRRTGRLPAGLTELGIEAPPDPFSGGQLIYRHLPDGFVVYSVGPGARDQSGDPDQDLVFHVRL